jgi:hypothetical protein
MKQIPLTNGECAIVDDDDFDTVNQHRWMRTLAGYAVTTNSRRRIRMHRLVMDAPANTDIDHINRNKLDNRKENLRFCTQAENARNASIRTDNISGYKGVRFKANRWEASTKANGKRVYIGRFLTAEEAARAYDQVIKKLHGDFASTNFKQE